MNIVIPTTLAVTVTCPPNAHHGGTVEWVPDSNERHPRCPVCGRL